MTLIDAQTSGRAPTVLVVGAHGFLGGFVAAALRRRGFRVVSGVRAPRPGRADERRCDLAAMDTADAWGAALAGVDAVVNAAGILRESGAQTFERVHERGPLALAQSCVTRGVHRFVQISALGTPEDGEFIASKQRFDTRLLALPLDAVVLRPSVVYALAGSYGGTSLLRALAALPGVHWLPGHGRWQLQPVAVEDLAEVVARAVVADAVGVFEVGGPAPISLREHQQQWRRWLRIPGARAITVPQTLVSLQVRLWEGIGRGPVGLTMWRMLQRGNVTAADASARLEAAFAVAPRGLEEVLAQHPSQTQDRWQAQLYFLAPLLRAMLVLLWGLSAAAGLATPEARIVALVDGAMSEATAVGLARAGGVLDAVLALWLALGWRPRWALAAMVASIVVYTVVLGALLPGAWLDPLGGLVKNLIVLPAIAVLWVLIDRR